MNKRRLFAAAVIALPSLLLGASAKDVSGPMTGSVPKAVCGRWRSYGKRIARPDDAAGTFQRRFRNRLQLQSGTRWARSQGEGAYSQDGPAYYGVCAYYGTDSVTATAAHPGIKVIDASDPQHPVVDRVLDRHPRGA